MSERRDSPLIRLWLGQLLSAIGDRLHLVALMWIAVEAVGERAGLVAAAGPLAQLLLGLFGGVYADRLDKRRVMLAADLMRAIAVATLPIAASFGPLSLWHLAGVGFALGGLDGLFQPSLRASLPLLSADLGTLQRANAWFEMTKRTALIVGPPLTGALLAHISIEEFFAVNAATFAVSACFVGLLSKRHEWKLDRDVSEVEVWSEIRGAYRELANHRPVFWSIALTTLWNVASTTAMVVGLPLIARDVLGGGPGLYGYLMGAYGVGNVAANLILVWRPNRRPVRSQFFGGVYWGIGIIVVGLTRDPTLAMIACAFAALGGPIADVNRAYLMQTDFPPDQIGKIYSLRVVVARVSNGVGLILAGPIIAGFGVGRATALGGVVVLAASLALLLRFWNVEPRPWLPRSGSN